MHYLGVFGQHGELHDLLGRLVEDLIPNDDAGSKLEGIRQDIAEFRNAGSRFVRKRSEGSLGPGGEPVEYKINQESTDERNHDESQRPRETRPGHLPRRYREEGAGTSLSWPCRMDAQLWWGEAPEFSMVFAKNRSC